MGHENRYAFLTHVIESVSRVSSLVTRNERVNEFSVRELSRVLTSIDGTETLRARSSLILNCSSGEFPMYICCSAIRGWWREREAGERVQFPFSYASQSEVTVRISR